MRSLVRKYTLPGLIICVLGLSALWALYAFWLSGTSNGFAPCLAALISVLLFALVCLRFVPGWMRFWSPGKYRAAQPELAEPERVRLGIFLALLLYCFAVHAAVYLLYLAAGRGASLSSYLEFTKCLDSGHYIDIARDWYLSGGDYDRVVQLVFLPGYPLAIRLAHLAVPNWPLAGILVSSLCFSGSGCVIYSLLRLDYGHGASIRTLKYLCAIPGTFFFVYPMSESLFLLLSAGCVYLARRRRYGPGCLLGMYAAFTRSLGLMLFVPVCMELIHEQVNAPRGERRPARFLWLLLIPAGFGAYLLINYQVSGNPFQYMIYQSEHWGQRFGLFFNTAAYQARLAAECASSGNAVNLFGLWLPNLIFTFSALAAMVYAAPKMRPSYAAWFIAYYYVAMGATWLLSAPRYLISLIPFTLSVSLLAKGPRRDAALTALCIAGSILYAWAFVLRWQVW